MPLVQHNRQFLNDSRSFKCRVLSDMSFDRRVMFADHEYRLGSLENEVVIAFVHNLLFSVYHLNT